MNKVLITILVLTTNVLFAQIIPANRCIQYPALIQKNNFPIANSAFSTNEVRKKGLYLVELDKTTHKTIRSYQHPSWNTAGYLGAIVFDNDGNIFTYPTPHVNLLDNPPSKGNIIYKIDGLTGEMKAWTKLFTPQQLPDENVFGILGCCFSCFSKSLYVSTVMGSTLQKENGKIYQLNAKTGTVLDSIENFDGFGINVFNINQKNFLLVGNARNSQLYYIELKQGGGFMHRPKPLFSIEGMGPRGDDRIKKIVYKQQENALFITGFEFFFNLSATLEKQETIYGFRLDAEQNKWVRIQ